MKPTETTYTKEFRCNNCGETFFKLFKFGTVAEKGDCTHCGVSDYQLSHENNSEKEYI